MIKAQYLPSERKEMLEFITNKPNVSLEVGCREGLFSKNLKQYYNNIECWGIEPDKTIQTKAKKNLDNFILGLFDKETKLPKKYFDLIIFNDVLEHMYDPWGALEKAKEILTKDGIIIASIPNIRHKSVLKDLIFNDNFEYKSAGILDITHIRFFTKRTMIKLFKDAGYEILKCKPIKPIKRKRWYKSIMQLPKKIFNIITFNKFESMQHGQYGFTVKLS